MSIENGCDYYFSCDACKHQTCRIVKLNKENKALLESKTMWKRLHTELCQENAELKAEVDKCYREVGKMCMEERKQVAREILEFAEEHSIGASIILKTFIKEEYGVEL